MATHTLGTAANNSLTALTYLPGYNSGMLAADVATIDEAIKRQGSSHGTTWASTPGGGFSFNGKLFLPNNRGVIAMQPGDVVWVDAFGFCGIVSKQSIADGSSSWVFT